jgi:hypothetical protein
MSFDDERKKSSKSFREREKTEKREKGMQIGRKIASE